MVMTQPVEQKARVSPVIAVTCAVIALILVQMVVGSSGNIYWDGDPRAASSAIVPTVFGPTSLAWLSVISAAIAGAAFWVGGRANRTVCVLTGLGVIACGLHMNDHFEDMRRLGSWIAALVTAMAAHHLAQHEQARRYMVAALIAILIPLTIDSLLYRFYEIPMTIKHFYANEAEFLQSRGWQRDSAHHQLYIRRLESPDVIGPIGLSNVFGSMMAALTVLAACAACRQQRLRQAIAPGIAALGGLVMVLLTHSKGAVLALIVTSGLVSIAILIPKWRRWMPRAAMVLVAAAFFAVLARGAIGPPESSAGERSILFRYHYWQAAGAALAAAPSIEKLTGLGVNGFAGAYLRHKNPLNPEDVTSSHSVFVDYVVMLGVGGVAISLLLILWLWRSSHRSDEVYHDMRPPPPLANREVYVGVLLAAIIFGVQLIYQFLSLLSPESFLGWAVGAMGFIVCFALLATPDAVPQKAASVGLFGAAALLLIHGQIEMTFFQEGAAPFALGMVAIAAAKPKEDSTSPGQGSKPAAVVLAALAIALLIGHAMPMTRHQRALADAALALRGNDHEQAVANLKRAHEIIPVDPLIVGQTTRLLLEQARRAQSEKDLAAVRRLIREAQATLEQWPGAVDANLLRLKAQTHLYAAVLLNEPDRRADAVAVLERVLELAPYNLPDHLRLGDLYWQLRRIDDAKRMYARCEKLHEQAYLDPAKQLAERDLQRVRQRLGRGGR